MKKLLLASTALVASAGIAAATDFTPSGSAEIGVFRAAGDDNLQLHQDLDIDFALRGDNGEGISFGADIDLDELGDGISNTDGPAAVFVAAGGARLTIGDTDGAFDARIAEAGLAGGSIVDDETGHAGFQDHDSLDDTEDGQVARFDYAFSGVTISLSAELDDDGETAAVAADTISEVVLGADLNGDGDSTDVFTQTAAVAADGNDAVTSGIGISYSAALAGLDLGFGLAYQAQEDNYAATGVSVSTTLASGLSLMVSTTSVDFDGAEVETNTSVGVGYSAGALTIGANYGVYENAGGVNDQTNSGFGLAVNYALGAGLTAQLGFGSSDVEGADATDSVSLGLAMSF